ncbi:MAG: hypothetical protein CM1200mP36_06660 [Gammaproteobacteria bacterium]|nr:MAG: hypothetical protein CM1200mP36_06660 [Gammaproteobacteria bacterium]
MVHDAFLGSFLIWAGFVYWQTLSFMEQELRSPIDLELAQSRDFTSKGVDGSLPRLQKRASETPRRLHLFGHGCRPIAGDHGRGKANESVEVLCREAQETDGWLLFELDIPRGF